MIKARSVMSRVISKLTNEELQRIMTSASTSNSSKGESIEISSFDLYNICLLAIDETLLFANEN